jgi:translation elongation factor P/translation initiation factor 5A
MSRRWQSLVTLVWVGVFVCAGSFGLADEGTVGIHHGLSGVIAKIQSGVLFVKIPHSLQPRTISPNKADRVGLHNARTGESVVMLVDSGNVLLDVANADRALTGYRVVVGTLHYADPYWGEVQLSTPDGFERFEVDALAGSKLSVFQEGMPVAIELDGDNVMIDIYRTR